MSTIIGVSAVIRQRSIPRGTNTLFVGLLSLTIVTALFNVLVMQPDDATGGVLPVDVASQRQGNVNIVGGPASSSHRGLREQAKTTNQEPQPKSPPRRKLPRVLLGIFTRDDAAGAKQRQYYRTLFQGIWKDDPRICRLPDFQKRVSSTTPSKSRESSSEECLLIYTFVVGAHNARDKSVPTEIVEDLLALPSTKKDERPLLVDKIARPYSNDINLPDVTRLNIRENDHDGKSQTFLNYAYHNVMGNGEEEDYENPLIEYCMKISPDTFLSLEKYFAFSQTDLAPAPFHRGVIAGALRDKSYWMSDSSDEQENEELKQGANKIKKKLEASPAKDLPRLESFWGNEFEGIHLYMSGQLYILSHDLVDFILSEVSYSRSRVAPGGYVIGKEAHDISSMAFHSPTPLQVITIGTSQRFWEHPLKTDAHWKRLLEKERDKIQ